jgi:hypothetical protein
MMRKRRHLGSLRDDVVRAVKANAERCKGSAYVKQSPMESVACRAIGLEISFAILKSGKVKEELDRGFRLCRKRYERKDYSRERELISCVAGMDEVTSAFGYRTFYDRSTKGWKAVLPSSMNGR